MQQTSGGCLFFTQRVVFTGFTYRSTRDVWPYIWLVNLYSKVVGKYAIHVEYLGMYGVLLPTCTP